MIKNENFISVQGWMRNELDLKGNELLIYASIYGFTQAEGQKFTGSLQYLADWCGATKQGVLKNLKSLVDKGLICKEEKFINGVKFVEYYATEFNTPLNYVEQGGVKLSLPNNKDSFNNKENTKERKKDSYNSIVIGFTPNVELQNALFEFVKMRKLIKRPMTDKALLLLLKKLNEISEDDETQIRILEQSIINNWQSVYPLKSEQNQKKSTVTRDDSLDDIF